MGLIRKHPFITATLLAVLFIGGGKVLHKSRGLRNNNPGNLKELPGDSTQWVGERATDDDPIFEEFTDPKYGIRAMGRVLDSYEARGIFTVRDIIRTWAPGTENDTEAYIKSIKDQTGLIGIRRVMPSDRPAFVAGIIKHENGVNPYSLAYIAEALALA